ncbi:MAG: hypothetical protein QM783_13890 [Phycisphaerales bacterium]
MPPEANAWFDKWSPQAAMMVVGSGFRELVEAIEVAQPGGDVQQPGGGVGGPLGPIARIKDAEAAGLYVGPPATMEGGKEGGGGGNGGMSVWAALRVRERRLLGDRELDTVGCEVAARLEKGWRGAFGGGMNEPRADGVPVPDPAMFAALPPAAARVTTVRMAPGDVLTGNSTDARPGIVTWLRTPAPGGAKGPADPDWSVMGVEPVSDLNAVGERQRGLAALLGSPPAPGPALGKDWVWRGVLRPRAVLRSLPMPMGFAMGVVGIGSVGEVRFETWNEAGEEHTRIVIDWDEKDAKP